MRQKIFPNYRSTRICVATVFLTFLLTTGSPAQTLTGEIDATIVDRSGAIVPNAKLTIKKAGTSGVLRTLTSASDGTARASLLEAGSYDLTVEASGFSNLLRRDVTVAAAQVVSLQLMLTPGSISESVTVVGETPQLESETSTLDQVYSQSQMVELPLNGRNYLNVGNLSAGAIPSRGTRDQTFSAYGNSGIQNAFVLDGARNENYMRGLQTRTRDLVRPPLDALQEFTVQSSNFSAEYGASAGAVVLAVTKSGTNQLHGSTYEFLQNGDLNAKNLFAPPGPTPLFIRNQYGGSLGGPILKNRLWIFGAYEGTDQVNHAVSIATIPTPAQINGVFTTPIYNPFTTRANPSGSGDIRDPFPGNTIPASLFDPIGKALLARYPAPNASGVANNYNREAVQDATNRNGVIRSDWRVSDHDSMFGRFSVGRLAFNAQPPLPEPAETPATQPADSWSIGYGYTRIFTPTLINELRFTWTRQTSDQESTMALDQIIPGALDPRIPSSIPKFAVTGYETIGGEPAGVGNNPSLRSEGIYNFSDNLSWTHGKHTVQTGFDAQIVRLTSLSALNGRGSFTFNGVFTQNPQSRPGTGSPVADTLLGTAEAVTTGTISDAAEREHNLGMYVQDRWAVTPRITLTAGLRYELFFPPIEANDQLANFILNAGDPFYGKLVLAGTQGKPRALVQLQNKDFSPRMGVAWRVPGVNGLVIRSAYGIFYAQDEGTGLTNRLTNNPPYVGLGAQSIVSDQLFPSTGFILSQGVLPPLPSINPQDYVLLPSYTAALRSWDERNLTPYVEEWNLSVQKQLPGNMLFEVNYVGNLGIHLLTSSNPNQPLTPAAGSPNTRRPLAQYTHGSVIFISPANRSSFQGISSRLQKQLSHGVSLLTSFTYGHAIDWQNEALDVCDGCPSGNTFPNSYDLKSNRGNSDNDVRLRYVFSGVWSLPFGPSHALLKSGFGGVIARDWNISGIWTAQTGTWSSVALSFDNTNVGSTSRPNRVCDGSLSNPTTGEYFNTACFVTPPEYTYGNAGRNIVLNPGVFNIDLMLARNFPLPKLGEGSRLQFRSEFFNLLNHPIWGQPGVTVGTPAFGVISSTAQPNRQLQFALRLVF